MKHRRVTQLSVAISLPLHPVQAQHLAAFLAGQSGFCFSYAHVPMTDNSHGAALSGFTFGGLILPGHIIAMTSFAAMNGLDALLFHFTHGLISHSSEISISPGQKDTDGRRHNPSALSHTTCRELFVIWYRAL